MKKFLSILVVLAVLAAVATFLMPAETHVERTIEIDAPPEFVFRYVSDFREFNKWSPWARLDPKTDYQYEGPDSGVGAIMRWSSQHPKVGSGSQEIVDADPPRLLKTRLNFGEDMGKATSSYILEPSNGGTRLIWAFDVEHGWNPVDRAFGLMMDDWVGSKYEQGLSNLKELAEADAVDRIETREIRYSIDGEPFTGYLAWPAGDDQQQHPGVLVVHEWWGHNEYARRRAEMLARSGYTAFALDMYGKGKLADHPDTASKFMNQVMEDAEVAKTRFREAMELLKSQPQTNPEQIAAIGYCFGGAVVLSAARAGMDLDAVASFHGALGGLLPAKEGEVTAKIRVFTGADDPMAPEEQRQAFKQEMDAAGADYEMIVYPDTKHSFTNPGADEKAEKFDLPLEYNAKADADSWQKMLALFEQVFSEPENGGMNDTEPDAEPDSGENS